METNNNNNNSNDKKTNEHPEPDVDEPLLGEERLEPLNDIMTTTTTTTTTTTIPVASAASAFSSPPGAPKLQSMMRTPFPQSSSSSSQSPLPTETISIANSAPANVVANPTTTTMTTPAAADGRTMMMQHQEATFGRGGAGSPLRFEKPKVQQQQQLPPLDDMRRSTMNNLSLEHETLDISLMMMEADQYNNNHNNQQQRQRSIATVETSHVSSSSSSSQQQQQQPPHSFKRQSSMDRSREGGSSRMSSDGSHHSGGGSSIPLPSPLNLGSGGTSSTASNSSNHGNNSKSGGGGGKKSKSKEVPRIPAAEDRLSTSSGASNNSSQQQQQQNDDRIRLGICAMDKKARSKPMAEILSRLDEELFQVIFFGDDMILNQPVQEWPVCQVLIAFFSKGYPLPKAKEYVALRKPFILNDLEMQETLQDRRRVYDLLEESGIDVPRHVYVSRDGYQSTGTGDGNGQRQQEVQEFDDHIEINGITINKPFVEKPVNAEDHNIAIYYPTSAGGGCKKLFRKVGNRSSEFYPDINEVRRDGSYIYEEFVETQGTDVKMYTVGPDYGHAEARKSPTVDGKVERNSDGKEVRFPVILTFREKEIARRIVIVFKQFVCGFDILRVQEGHTVVSCVCDVNGWSFVKNSRKYYDDCAQILAEHLLAKMKPDALTTFSTLDPLVTTSNSLNHLENFVGSNAMAANDAAEVAESDAGSVLSLSRTAVTTAATSTGSTSSNRPAVVGNFLMRATQMLKGEPALDDLDTVSAGGGGGGFGDLETQSQTSMMEHREREQQQFSPSRNHGETGELLTTAAATLIEGAVPVREFPDNLTSEPASLNPSTTGSLNGKGSGEDDDDDLINDLESSTAAATTAQQQQPQNSSDHYRSSSDVSQQQQQQQQPRSKQRRQEEPHESLSSSLQQQQRHHEAAPLRQSRSCSPNPELHQEELRCVLAIVRHGDRTPKQKLKVDMTEPHILEYFHKHCNKADCTSDLKVKAKAPLTEFLQTVKTTLKELSSNNNSSGSGNSSPAAGSNNSNANGGKQQQQNFESHRNIVLQLTHMRDILERWKIHGLNRKLQIKPRSWEEHRDPLTGEPKKRCTKVQLILKWGGNLTKLGEKQAIALGHKHRHDMYPDAPGGGILRLHSTFRHDLKIKTSDEGRVMKTAAAFAKGLLELEGDLPPILVSLVHKEKGSMHMLDPTGNKEVKKDLDVCKDKITANLQRDIDVATASEEDLYQLVGPKELTSLRSAIQECGNPRKMLMQIYKTMGTLISQLEEMLDEIGSGDERRIEGGEGVRGRNDDDVALSGVKLYKGETLLELTERWRFIYDRLYDAETDQFDLSRIPDVHDNVRFDVLHNPHLGLTGTLQKLYDLAKIMADCVVPQEYGTTLAEKRNVGVKICHGLLEKIKYDLNVARTDNKVDMRYMINMNYEADLPINTMGRRIRTRLYFTSESHLHTVLNVFRFAQCNSKGLLSEHGSSIVNGTRELCYLTQIVMRVFEDRRRAWDDPRRFRVEILFSPGAAATPSHIEEDEREHDAARFGTEALQIIGREGLTCAEVEDFFEQAIMAGKSDDEGGGYEMDLPSTSEAAEGVNRKTKNKKKKKTATMAAPTDGSSTPTNAAASGGAPPAADDQAVPTNAGKNTKRPGDQVTATLDRSLSLPLGVGGGGGGNNDNSNSDPNQDDDDQQPDPALMKRKLERKYFWGTIAVASIVLGMSCLVVAADMAQGRRRRWSRRH